MIPVAPDTFRLPALVASQDRERAATSIPATSPAEASPLAAIAVVRHYYEAIDARDYHTAYRLWHGRYTFAQVRAGYADTAHVKVTPIFPVHTDGAAGSIYCEVKVRVDAVLNSGRRQRFGGSFTLRRVNDVDGATAEQRRWHIVAAKLRAL
jgi:hypothetical protein